MSETQASGSLGAEQEPFVPKPLKESYDRSFACWANDFLECGRYETSTVPEVDRRIREIVRLRDLLPPADQWDRAHDKRLHDRDQRYLRGKTRRTAAVDHIPKGEHLIEHNILSPDPSSTPMTSLGLPLIDGINAVPLAKDRNGGRSGNVEADMLLLVGQGPSQQLHLVEVKERSNNAWFAVVESLRQLLLFEASEIAQNIMIDRRKAPAGLKATGIVLAPETFYTATGKKLKSVEPAQQLLHHAEKQLGLRCVLALWNEQTREIKQWDS